jgi:octopine oxidase subunit A
VEGVTAATGVRFAVDGQAHTLPVDQLLLHQGVVPDINLAGAAGCALAWNELQACFAPVADDWGGTTVPGLYVAGDGAGIAGAMAAEARGRLTALGVANALGSIDASTRERAAQRPRRDHAIATRGRLFLDTLYRPADTFRLPEGETLACRCEEVSAAAITELARSGCAGPNQVKAFARCGMGPCQGRWCGLTVTELIARTQHRDPAEVGYFRLRFPARPIPLGEIAALPTTDEAVQAVARTSR